jgi:hypothetical protein
MGPYARADFITSPYVDTRVDSKTFTMGNPMPESALTLHAKVDFIPLTVTKDLASEAAAGDVCCGWVYEK